MHEFHAYQTRLMGLKEKLGVDLPSGFSDESYPGFAAPVILKSQQTYRVVCGLAKFGLIRAWAKHDKIARHTYNAKTEPAAVIQVFLQTNRFREDLPQYMPSLAVPLPYPTNDSLDVNRWANYLCQSMFKVGYPYKKAGVMLSEISPVTHFQGDLTEPEPATNSKLMLALDTLNQRFGRDTVRCQLKGHTSSGRCGRNASHRITQLAGEEMPTVK